MLRAPCVLAILLGLGTLPSPDPSDLVHQLGSPRFAIRESAEGELIRIGRAAIPALRSARDSKDAEIRARSIAILAKIDNSLLLQATPVLLDFVNLPIPDAVDAINRQAGLSLTLSPDEKSNLAGRRVTLRSEGPLPLWNAIDIFCASSGMHPVAQGGHTTSGTVVRPLLLVDGMNSGMGPVSDSGPFRVQLASLHYQSDIQLTGIRPIPTARRNSSATVSAKVGPTGQSSRQFFLQFLVSAEPRLSINQDGPIRLTSVVDDRGQSLLDLPASGHFQHDAGYFGMNPSSNLRLRVDLNYPDSPGKSIQLIRGTIPIVVAARKPDPLIVPLLGPPGRSFRADDASLTLIEYRPSLKDSASTVQISIKPSRTPSQPVEVGVGEPLGYRPDAYQDRIEVLDIEGRTLSWFPSATFYNGDETRLTLTLASRGTTGAPATLRYHDLIRANSEVSFEFRDIPIP